jgi:hypothetical protein
MGLGNWKGGERLAVDEIGQAPRGWPRSPDNRDSDIMDWLDQIDANKKRDFRYTLSKRKLCIYAGQVRKMAFHVPTKEQVFADYRAGMGRKEICKKYHANYATISTWIDKEYDCTTKSNEGSQSQNCAVEEDMKSTEPDSCAAETSEPQA